MNGENNHIFHTSALDGAHDHAQPQPYVWALFVAQLWVLAAFVGMSLVAVAARLFFEGFGGDAFSGLLLLVLAGAALMFAGWRNAADLLGRTERELAHPDRPSRARDDHAPRTSLIASPAPAHARITGITPTL